MMVVTRWLQEDKISTKILLVMKVQSNQIESR